MQPTLPHTKSDKTNSKRNVQKNRLKAQCFCLFVCSRLGISLQASLLQIVGYRNLVVEVEKLRREPYDSENPEHEEILLKVGMNYRLLTITLITLLTNSIRMTIMRYLVIYPH